MRDRPDLRAAGRIVAILEPTPRRNRIVGVLQKESETRVALVPVDLRLPRYLANFNDVPRELRDSMQASTEDSNHCCLSVTDIT